MTLFILFFLFDSNSKPLIEDLYNRLPFGSYDVGYRIRFMEDVSRQIVDLKTGKVRVISRPIQAQIWYPAQSGDTFWPYGEVLSSELTEIIQTKPTVEEVNAFLNEFEAYFGADSSLMGQTKSLRNAVPISKAFPTLLYWPGQNGSPARNSILFEFLASHGFVVIAIPSRGFSTTYTTESSAGIQAMTDDMSFVLNHLKSDSPIDLTRVSVMGRSWGACSAVHFSHKNPWIKSLISLDGTVGYQHGLKAIKSSNPHVVVTAPLMMLFSKTNPNYPPDYSLAETSFAPYYIKTFSHLEHYDFCALGTLARAATLSKLENKQELLKQFVNMANHVLAFLEQTNVRGLNLDPSLFQSIENGGKDGIFRQFDHDVPNLSTWMNSIDEGNTKQVAEQYWRLKNLNREWKPFEEGMPRWIFVNRLQNASLEGQILFLNIVVNEEPENPYHWQELAYCHAQNNAFDEVRHCLRQIKIHRPSFKLSALEKMVSRLVENEQTELAEKFSQEISRIFSQEQVEFRKDQ